MRVMKVEERVVKGGRGCGRCRERRARLNMNSPGECRDRTLFLQPLALCRYTLLLACLGQWTSILGGLAAAKDVREAELGAHRSRLSRGNKRQALEKFK